MDLELVMDDVSEEDTFGVDENIDDYSTFDGERCGICMDIVIDRGVLDCCEHWFCFGCIDNWATITNLCPLCENEFQMITCVPVYDTIGSNKGEDASYSRDDDDDWCIDGENNTLSFPSYYIDENAVVCLDGDGCKIKSGSVTFEEVSNLDTSIACDSCDVWYHAFCVGFDPEGTCESSWLCPRCIVAERKSIPEPSRRHGEIAVNQSMVDASFSGKVSVSIADDGETAVVVSMIDGYLGAEVPSEKSFSTTDVSEDLNNDQLVYSPFAHNCSAEMASSIIDVKPMLTDREAELALPQETCFTVPSNSDVVNGMKTDSDDQTTDLHLASSSVTSFMSVDKMNNTRAEVQAPEDVPQENNAEECLSPVDKITPDEKVNIVRTTSTKQKLKDYRTAEAEDEDTKPKIKTKVSAKRVKIEKRRADESISDKENVGTSIMDIVQGTNRKPRNRLTSTNPTDAAGLRVKKIMRRPAGDNNSSVQLQNLRKEIREAVRNKSSKELEENLFDKKLLSAFRAAVTIPNAEYRKPIVDLKAKKSLLQKGKVRENLTKRIYGIGGRRRRAWTRDCEIEFWKHRCSKTSKPEKIQTLKSVLDLLKTYSVSEEMIPENEGEAKSSILSRLYVADTSVFPRKDDIKPLSVRNAVGIHEPSKENRGLTPPTHTNDVSPQGSKGSSASIRGEAGGSKVNISKCKERLVNSKKETVGKSDDVKSDKRKWAMELLARKAAVTSKNGSQEKKQDTAMLKGNYPLLAQLPIEMRPELASCRHNKIPISVRQAQLYRLTEHLLRKTNLSVTSRTAKTELAVADAVNIEKEVADKSNSKLVYINLCVQEISRRSDNTENDQASESIPTENDQTSGSIASPKIEIEELTKNIFSDSVVEALKNTGLLSDSPPNSPQMEEEGPENVIEMDSNAELDIYGDFEYDLEDEDFIGVNALKISNSRQQQEEEDKEEEKSKMKLVFAEPKVIEMPKAASSGLVDGDSSIKIPPQNPVLINGGDSDGGRGGGGEGDDSTVEYEELYGPDKELMIKKFPERALADNVVVVCGEENQEANASDRESGGQNSPEQSQTSAPRKNPSRVEAKAQAESGSSVVKKVEAYIKEHIRPLCRSGVISVQQYKWAVGKTTDKVMRYHSKDRNAKFLIKEGDKVKKLAEEYVEASQKLEKN